MYYQNVIERKAKCREVKAKVKSTIRKVVDKTIQLLALDDTFYDEVIKNIKLGIEYLGEIRYYKNGNKLGMASIETELSDYHLHKNNNLILKDTELDVIFNTIVDLVKLYFQKYKDVEVSIGVDEALGEYFEVKLNY